MLKRSIAASALLSALFLNACGSKMDKNSDLMITPRNTMVLGMQNAIYGDALSFANGEVELAFEQSGVISYILNADIAIGRITLPRQMRLANSYQASPSDVMFATYRNLADMKTYDHKKGGAVITRFTRMKALDREGSLGFLISHFESGATGQVLIKEGRNGLVDIVEVKMASDNALAVSMVDEESQGYYGYDEVLGYYHWFQSKLLGSILGGSELSLKAID